MATSQPDKTTGTGAPTPSANVEGTVSLPNEAAPAAAVTEDASTTSARAAPASQEQDSAEAAPVPTASAGASTAVEHDPAPIQPPIQPVSVSSTEQRTTQSSFV